MRTATLAFLFLTGFSLAGVAASASPLATLPDTIVVDSTADSGTGTLRQALLYAQNGDTITFDPAVFPPAAPVTISITSILPTIWQRNLTIDASEAGVILDGSSLPGDWKPALQIVSSDGNRIQGLQISNFRPGRAIDISGDSQHNVIGGSRDVGAGPYGQGNLLVRNGTGIIITQEAANQNTIAGNLIGTDSAGTSGLGNGKGIWIAEGAHGNIIGPDNVIARNWTTGIVVQDQGSLHNTITQNSVYDNGWDAIDLWDGGNAELAAPAVVDYNLPAGTLRGGACPNCTVEIFSDSSDEGANYEGQVAADGTGYFTFSRGTPFLGPHVTATATDVDGNTSPYSPPTTGTVRSLLLQQGNHLPVAQLRTRHSGELLDNRIGFLWDSIPYESNFDPYFYNFGFKRARMSLSGMEPELVDWDKPEFYVHPDQDAMFDRMVDNGFTITYVLMFWDMETWPNGEGAPCARFKTKDEVLRYLDFVRFIIRHFKDRIQYYELWNEPDIANYCPKWIQIEDYLNLARLTIPVIREEYPEAKIVVGGVSNTRFGGRDYLFDLLESDIMPLVDVIAWNPMFGTAPDYEVYKDYYYNYPSFAQEIKDTASAHGFQGEYQADTLTWRTPETAIPGQPWVHGPVVVEKYFGRGVLMHLGMDIGAGVGHGTATVRNLCTVMAGAEAEAVPVRIQTSVTDTVTYTFSSPSDQHLVALWTDGIAVDFDPGIATTVTLPGLVDHTVIGVDILHGYEQELITSEENGDLVIHDLMVKDYPIILRVSPIVEPASLAISGPTTGLLDATYSFTATVDPITVTTPLTYTWRATGQSVQSLAKSLTVADSVTFTWATTGAKSITVTAQNAGGTVTSTHLVTIYEPVAAGFVGAPTSGLVPLTVAFTNSSSGDYTEGQWQFGDGLTSTLQSPMHTYTAVGTYSVTLSINGPGGMDTETKAGYITVEPFNVYLPLVTRDAPHSAGVTDPCERRRRDGAGATARRG